MEALIAPATLAVAYFSVPLCLRVTLRAIQPLGRLIYTSWKTRCSRPHLRPMPAPDFSPTPASILTIRFQDCDPFNHLNNGRYTDYFLNAREDQLLEHYGLDIYRIARETGACWVVSTSQIAYLRPAITMEKVLIETMLISYAPKHVAVEMRMWDSGHRALKAFCWMGFVHFDLRTNSVKEHSAEYMELFKRVHQPVAERPSTSGWWR